MYAAATAAGPVCHDLGVDYLSVPVAKIRNLAQNCDNPALADLYYKRAYHLDLLARNSDSDSGLIVFGGQRSSLAEYRLYMAMLEAMAPSRLPDSEQRINFLRREYEHRVEIEELRLRGFDRLADRLERSRPTFIR